MRARHVHPEWLPEPVGGWGNETHELAERLSALAEAHPLWHFGGTTLPDLLTWADHDGQAEEGQFELRSGEDWRDRLRRVEPDVRSVALNVLGWSIALGPHHSWPLYYPPEQVLR